MQSNQIYGSIITLKTIIIASILLVSSTQIKTAIAGNAIAASVTSAASDSSAANSNGFSQAAAQDAKNATNVNDAKDAQPQALQNKEVSQVDNADDESQKTTENGANKPLSSETKKDGESFWEHNKNATYEKKAIEIKLGYATTTLVDIYAPQGGQAPQFISNGYSVGTGFGFNLGTGYSYYKDHLYLSAEILGQVWGGYSNPYFEGGSVGIRGKAGYNLFIKNSVVTLYKIAGLRAMVMATTGNTANGQYGYGLGIDLGGGISVKSLSYDWVSVYFELAPTLYLGEGYLGGPIEFGVYMMPQITFGIQFEI